MNFLIYMEEKVSSLKSINKFQSTTNEKFKQNMNKLVRN